jgi:PAS domain S-box-containing protein
MKKYVRRTMAMNNNAQRQRQESPEALDDKFFRLIVESVTDHAAIGIDLEGRILSWNPGAEKIIGYTKEEVVGKPFSILFTPEDRQSGLPECEIEIVRTRGSAGDFRWQMRKDGSRFWASGFLTPLRDEADNLIGYVKVVHDATEKKLADEQLKETLAREQDTRAEAESANRSKDEFIAMVSHELRSPLNAILGWTSALRKAPHDEQLHDRGLEVIERSARMQSQLIEDLMDTARAISGKMRLEVRPMNVAEVIEKAEEVVRPATEAKGISLDIRLDRNAGQITGDPDRLQQVVWNLLSNAVKFTNEGGRVEVRLERIDPYVQITVSDTGQGIKPEFLPHVFDRYRQANVFGGRRAGGLGLGLTLVRQLVEMHGGSVVVESEGEGKGATFTIKLPVRAVYTAETEGASPLGQRTLAGVWAVVVDDEADARALVASVLELRGTRVTAIGSAREALDLLTDDAGPRPDILISDLSMPDEDGISVIRKLREWERRQGHGALPAIALTAFARAQDRTNALEAGFQMYVIKPVEPAELVVAVRSLILDYLPSDKNTGPEG